MNSDNNLIVDRADKGPFIVYGAYIASFVFPLFATLVGLVWAYVSRANASAQVQSHYQFAIRTFWIGMLYGVLTTILVLMSFGLLGFVLPLALAVWWIVRVVKGAIHYNRGEFHPNPTSWWVG